MAISRWTPIGASTSFRTAIDRLFGELLQGEAEGGAQEGALFRLPVDIKESDDGYEIRAPIPGFKPEEVEVTVSDGVLMINAKHTEEKSEEKPDYVRREIAHGTFMRQIALPADVRADNVKATFEDGVLIVNVPRAAKPERQRIAVQPGKEKPKELAGETANRSASESSSQTAPTAESNRQEGQGSRSQEKVP